MAEVNIFSKNATYQKFEVLKTNRNKRYKYNEFLVEGVRSLNEAVKNGWKINALLYDKNNLSGWAKDMIRQVPTQVNYNLTPELMRDLSGKGDTSELMAILEMRQDRLDTLKLSKTPFLVLFDRPSNRGNLGTMIRSCDALGADALLITGHAVDLYDPDVVVSAMGSFFNLPVIRVEDNNELFAYVEQLRQQYPGFTLLGTTAHKELPVYNANLTVPLLLMALIVGVLVLFPRETTFLFGGSERLVPMVTDYLVYVSPTMLMCVILYVGMFVLRLDGAPNYAMTANIINSVLNIVLDYVFIFPLGMGVKGAAIATSISTATGALIILAYFFCCSKKIHLYMPKFTLKAIRLTLRNVGYMMKVGLSMLVGETAMACMMIVGNFMFMSRLNEDGVAAFSVACYLTPLVFMVGNAVSQSSLPIVSYNYGLKNYQRIATTFRLIMKVGTIAGVLITAMGIWGGEWLVGLFLEQGIPAWQIAVEGFPLFSLGFAFFTLNLVLIGYYQGMKCSRQSTVFMLLRGYLFVVPFFLLLPQLAGNAGLWLAVPLSELLTCITILIYYKMKNDKLTILNYLIGLGDKRR